MQYKDDPIYLLVDFCRYLIDNRVVVIGMTDGDLEVHFKVYLKTYDYKQPADMKRFIWLFMFFFMTTDQAKGETRGLDWQHHEAQALPRSRTASMTAISW
jgi:hypothetical protein